MENGKTEERKQSDKLSKRYYQLMKEGLSLLSTDKPAAEKKFSRAAQILKLIEGTP